MSSVHNCLKLIANEKVVLDRFNSQYDRRVAVYEATRTILEQVFRGRALEADTRSYGLRVLEARFLFDEDMFEYLRDIRRDIDVVLIGISQSESATSEEEKMLCQSVVLDNVSWLVNQLLESPIVKTRFGPFLKYEPPSCPWLLRWP